MVGRPGKLVAVQVKCTVARLESGEGYICSTCSRHKPYKKGAFDYVAAYVIPEDAWYIIPAKAIYGLRSISLCTVGGEAKYEHYREAWGLLRKASGIGEPESEEETSGEVTAVDSSSALGRMQAAANFFRRQMERSHISAGRIGDKS